VRAEGAGGLNPVLGPGEARAATIEGRRCSEAYHRCPIFWGMMLAAPFVWAVAFFVVARIFHSALR